MSFCKISVNGGKSADLKMVIESGTVSVDEPDKTRYAFEDVLIKVGITWVGGDFAQDIDESLQDGDVLPDESLLCRDDNSHNTWERQLIRHQHAGIERHTHNA